MWGIPQYSDLIFGASALGISNESSSAQRLRPTNWAWAGPYRSWVKPIPESIVFRVLCPDHLGRTRFISIQSLSVGRPVLRKFSDRRSSLEDGPARLAILQPLSFPFTTLFFQSWSRAPIVTNPGGREDWFRSRPTTCIFSISLTNHKHSPLTFNGLLT